MKIVETLLELEKYGHSNPGSILTIGNFDGVHIGHQQILRIAKRNAVERQVPLLAMTFEPHPVAVLYPEKSPGVLTPLPIKQVLLASHGVDCLYLLKSTKEFLKLAPAEFVEKFIKRYVQPSVVVEGENFNFGYGRAGSVYSLQSLGANAGFKVIVVEAQKAKLSIGQAVRISSTMIRNLLLAGKVVDAAKTLGRPYRLAGKIVPGRGKGRELGFPTLNLEKTTQIIPLQGVYAGHVEIAQTFEQLFSVENHIPAVFSIGRAKTYGSDNPILIEAHLLAEDVSASTGTWMAMDFVEFIRGQQKFETVKDLANQITKDCREARRILAVGLNEAQ